MFGSERVWEAVVGAALLYVGVLVIRVHGWPSFLGGRRLDAQDRVEMTDGAVRWLDQYSAIGLALAAVGVAALLASRI